MRKSIIYILGLLVFIATSCKKDTTSGLSKITTFPVITISGEQWMAIEQGGTYTEAGATAKADEDVLEVTIGGDQVDTSTPGVYVITYTAYNEDGFFRTEKRYVGVIASDAAAIDLAGNWKRNAGAGGVAAWTKLANGHYYCNDAGGTGQASDAVIGVHVFHTTGNTLLIPEQISEDGTDRTISCVNAQVKLTTAGDANTADPGDSYTWGVVASGYGAAARTFVRQ